jgi:hypothetical protein
MLPYALHCSGNLRMLACKVYEAVDCARLLSNVPAMLTTLQLCYS